MSIEDLKSKTALEYQDFLDIQKELLAAYRTKIDEYNALAPVVSGKYPKLDMPVLPDYGNQTPVDILGVAQDLKVRVLNLASDIVNIQNQISDYNNAQMHALIADWVTI